jgi:multidrug efflux pump subunit AcrB
VSGFNLSALAVRERSVTLFVILLISIAGIIAFVQLGRAEDPAFTVKSLTVVTAWPGATAREMQDQVAERLEKRLQELRWYDRSETFARPGLAFTLLHLRDDMPPSEVQEEFYQARKKLGDEAHHLPAGVIFSALASQNVVTPAGSIDTRGPEVFIRLDGAFDELQKIRDAPIVARGRTVKLSDVASVERGYEDPATFLIRNGGEPTLLLGIIMREGWNGLELGAALGKEVGSINAGFPVGMSLTKVTDQAVNIRSAVDEFMLKFFVALGVVLLVCFLSMGWRVGIVVAAAVPLTLASVFVVMAATGKNFDRITLGSLILALGLLVDDAIIAIETMLVKMEEGYRRVDASAYAWSHTAAPMLSGTLVTAVGFMPNGFARSTAGEYTSNMFWIVGIALVASWIVAVAFTPYLGVKLLPDIEKVEGGYEAIYSTPTYSRLRRLLGRVIRRKWLVAAAVVGSFIVAVVGMGAVRKQFFLTSDRPEVLVELQLPYGTSIEETSGATKKVEDWLAKQAEAKIVTSYIGQGAPRFYLAMSPELPDPSFAKIVVLTGSETEREALKERLRRAAADGLASEARVRCLHPHRFGGAARASFSSGDGGATSGGPGRASSRSNSDHHRAR